MATTTQAPTQPAQDIQALESALYMRTFSPRTFQQGGQLLSGLRIGIDLHLSTSTTGISSARATRSRVASRATSAHRCCSAHVKTYASYAYKPCSVASVMDASRSTSRKRSGIW